MNLADFIKNIHNISDEKISEYPWQMTDGAERILENIIKKIPEEEYIKKGNVIIHKNAVVEENVILKGTIVISEGCFIAANAYIRGPVFLDKNVKVGPSSEIKASFIFSDTTIAHLNYVGNSVIGSGVNLEAGVVIANHYNERNKKEISVVINGEKINTGIEKFGALIGDNSRVGANAVLSPGTIMPSNSVAGRLQLVDEETKLF